MNTFLAPSSKRYRFPAEMIGHAIWFYVRFALSYRDVEALRAERGIVVKDETMRQWCQTVGQHDANRLRKRRAQPGDPWHLDAVFLNINGQRHDLWRAVDQDGQVRDSLVQLLSPAPSYVRQRVASCTAGTGTYVVHDSGKPDHTIGRYSST